MAWQISFNLNWNKGLRSIKYILSLLIKRVTVRKLLDRNSSMTLLFYYLAPMQIDTNVTSWCMQLIFGDKRAATCLIRECPTCDWKKRGREREKGASAYEMDIYCLMSFFYRINHLFCIVFSSIFLDFSDNKTFIREERKGAWWWALHNEFPFMSQLRLRKEDKLF